MSYNRGSLIAISMAMLAGAVTLAPGETATNTCKKETQPPPKRTPPPDPWWEKADGKKPSEKFRKLKHKKRIFR